MKTNTSNRHLLLRFRGHEALSLTEVKDALDVVFENEHERRWVTEAWAALIAERLADYSSELERCEAAINFIALVEFYKDWLENAEEGNRELRYGDVPAFLNLSAFRLGQLIGRHSDFLDDPDFSPYEGLSADEQLFRNSIFHLELEARPKVVAALQDYYGGISEFFVALWNSDKQPRPADYDLKREQYEEDRAWEIEHIHRWVPEYQETDDEILNDVTEEKEHLWSWLDQGAEPLQRY